jgi:hypothetical protein
VLLRDLATSDNAFWITETDFEEIMATAANFGTARDRFRECLREFVRSPSTQ